MDYRNQLFNLNFSQRREFYIKKNYIELYTELVNHNILDIKNFTQLCYHYYHNLNEYPLCNCGKELKFRGFGQGYRTYCSKKCIMGDDELVKKRNKKSLETSLEKYGVDNPMKNEVVKEKVKKTNLERYDKEYYFQSSDYKEKVKKTSLQKYGINHYNQSSIVIEKRNNTNLQKYGTTELFKSEKILKKIRKTNLERYNSNSHMIFKKENGLLDDFYLKNSYKYYYNQTDQNNYELINIDDSNLNMKHFSCGNNFTIQKQLFYLRNKNNRMVCTVCNSTTNGNISYMEKDLYNFIKNNYNGEIITNKKDIINPYELDIYLPELKISFEFNGLYWHNETNKPNDYHKIKSDLCEDKGIQLIHIYEDDWLYKTEIVKSLILNKLNKIEERIYAKKCEIREVTDNTVSDFLNKNDIRGNVKTGIKIGLYYNNELVFLMCFNRGFKLIRISSLLNIVIVGGANKIMKYFIDKYKPLKIESYYDRTWGFSEVHEILKFKKIKYLNPTCYYIIDKMRCEKIKSKEIFNKIYDSGKIKYEK